MARAVKERRHADSSREDESRFPSKRFQRFFPFIFLSCIPTALISPCVCSLKQAPTTHMLDGTIRALSSAKVSTSRGSTVQLESRKPPSRRQWVSPSCDVDTAVITEDGHKVETNGSLGLHPTWRKSKLKRARGKTARARGKRNDNE